MFGVELHRDFEDGVGLDEISDMADEIVFGEPLLYHDQSGIHPFSRAECVVIPKINDIELIGRDPLSVVWIVDDLNVEVIARDR